MRDFDYKKSLGQNFLVDENVKKKIVSSANIDEKSLIIEVGPGKGAISKYLVKLGVPVVAFEIDTRLREELSKIENLEVVYGDFLSVDLNSVLSKYNYDNIHLIANLPYYITTPIITKVMKINEVSEMIVMVQKEVGERFMSKPGFKSYNSLSVFLQYYFDVSEVCKVNRSCFVPVPKVDSIVVKFVRKKELLKVNDINKFFKLVKDSFKQKRKNLRNNLKSYDLNKLESILFNLNKDLTYRAEQLSIEDFVYISNNI